MRGKRDRKRVKRINENGGFDVDDNEKLEAESGSAGGKGEGDVTLSKAEKPFKSFVTKSRKGASKSWAKGFSSSMKFAPMNKNDDSGAATRLLASAPSLFLRLVREKGKSASYVYVYIYLFMSMSRCLCIYLCLYDSV